MASRLGEARDAAKDPSGHRTTPWLRVVWPRVSAGRELGPFGWGLGGPAVPGLHLASLAIRLPVSGTGPETWRVSNG